MYSYFIILSANNGVMKLKDAARETHESTLIGLQTLKHDRDNVISGERSDVV